MYLFWRAIKSSYLSGLLARPRLSSENEDDCCVLHVVCVCVCVSIIICMCV